MGFQFSFSNTYSPNLPKKMESSLLSLDIHEHAIENFKKWYHLLPLTIKQSSLDGAGKGMFAAAKIEKDSIVAIYNGFRGNHYEINMKSDSLFSLGWYYHMNHWQ